VETQHVIGSFYIGLHELKNTSKEETTSGLDIAAVKTLLATDRLDSDSQNVVPTWQQHKCKSLRAI
jgi:hypothetical protein